jgi:hypothetical protein
LKPGQTVTIMDCGGGTVDGVTYSIDSSYPLRLKDEAVEPGGENLVQDALAVSMAKK